MKMKLITCTALCVFATQVLADDNGNGNGNSKLDDISQTVEMAVDQTMTLNGQLNLGDVTATLSDNASVVADEAATASVTVAGIGNSLTSELDISVQQANLGNTLATLSGAATDVATVTVAAIGNSASLNLSEASGLDSSVGQLNTGGVTATIGDSIVGATDVTAAAIANSLTVTNSILD